MGWAKNVKNHENKPSHTKRGQGKNKKHLEETVLDAKKQKREEKHLQQKNRNKTRKQMEETQNTM
jgi:hypothetical protein